MRTMAMTTMLMATMLISLFPPEERLHLGSKSGEEIVEVHHLYSNDNVDDVDTDEDDDEAKNDGITV